MKKRAQTPGAVKSGGSRRRFVKGLLVAGVAAAVGRGAAGAQDKATPAGVTAADIAVADKLAGLDYGEPERALMVKSLTETRADLSALRADAKAQTLEPATHFEPRLPGTPVPTGKAVFRPGLGKLRDYDGRPETLAFASATELGRLLQNGKVTSTELTKMYLARLKKYGPRLNCVVALTEDLALAQAARADKELAKGRARGPLHGVPYGVKDLLATKGIPTTYGAKPYADQVFDDDATVVKRLEEAGAVLLAKLSMGELAMGDVWFGGLTRNPWNPKTGSSGSSAGPGSATAAGLVGFAIGTETLGSIVSPCVVNGVAGLRPTYGRVSRNGAMALCWTMDKIGPMARGVEDCALVLRAIYGPDDLDLTVADVPFSWNAGAKLSGYRVGLDQAAFDAVAKGKERARAKVYADALQILRDLGMALTPITLPKRTPAFNALAGTIIGVESAASFGELTRSGRVSELVQQEEGSWPNTFRVGSLIPAADYVTALRVRTQLQQEMAQALKDVDVYVTIPLIGPSLAYTNLTGHPTVVTRCGLLGDVPQSIEFTGALYREDACLRLAHAFEQATPFHKQWPDVEKLPETPPVPAKK